MTAHRLTDRHLRRRIIAEARRWCGTPYHHQGAVRGIGCDCLGLVRGIWRSIYDNEPEQVPPYSPDWAEADGGELLAAAARRHMLEIDCASAVPGDVLLFRWRNHLPAKHLAILTTPGSMVHAQNRACVCEVPFSRWWRRHLAFAFQFPPRHRAGKSHSHAGNEA